MHSEKPIGAARRRLVSFFRLIEGDPRAWRRFHAARARRHTARSIGAFPKDGTMATVRERLLARRVAS
jgi:hypothetical protein